MRIGELADQAGVTARALRHYESLGLLSAQRDRNGYRDYDGNDLRIVAEIRSLVDLGFALEETRPFIECLRAGNDNGGTCADSLAALRHKLADVDGYLSRLHAVRDQLDAQMRQALAERRAFDEDPRCEFSPTPQPRVSDGDRDHR
jgi:DNA-binding transcriptional MerR regulator